MSTTLNSLKNTGRPGKERKRVGRGTGSGMGKTCGRGVKGQGARSGYKRRAGQEGGQVPLFRKLPTRGFSNVRFRQEWDTVNIGDIEAMFAEGDTVNSQTLREKGRLSGPIKPLKILGDGELNKKVNIEAQAVTAGAKAKLEKAGISLTLVG